MIAARVGRSCSPVKRVVQSGSVRDGPRRRGPKRKLCGLALRLLLRKARSGLYTAAELQRLHAPVVSVRRVPKVLVAQEKLMWERPVKAPALKALYRTARLQWARAMLEKGAAHWRGTVFYDESHFSLDDPDGLSAYWRDKRGGTRYRVKRQRGGGGTMVWAAFGWRGKSELVFFDGSIDSEAYFQLLASKIVPWMDAL